MALFRLDRAHPPRRLVHRDATGALELRPWTVDDVDTQLEALLASREALRSFMPWSHGPLTRERQFEFFCRSSADYWAGREYTMGVFSEGGELLGGVGLHPRTALNPQALEVGYWSHTRHAGRGHTTRAVRMLVALAFDWFDCDRLQVMHDEANEASARVVAKCGFRLEGVQRNATAAVDQELVASGYKGTGRHPMYALCPEDLASLPWLADLRANLVVFDALGAPHRSPARSGSV